MPQTPNYKWESKDLIGTGAFGFVYKVSFVRIQNCFIIMCVFFAVLH